jgi:tripartite-type tricarboxylate transporter receptor subunit TctC
MIRAVLSLALAVLCTAAGAQYPSKPIRLIVPFPAGGAAEIGARIFSQPLGQALGQPVVVEAKPGGDGVIAADAVMKSPPDGYTLFYPSNTAFSYVPATRKNPPYDPVGDFTPVSLVGFYGFFLFAHPSVPANSAAELIAYARANPGKLNYGTGNSSSIVMTALLKQAEKLDIVEIPYKGDAPLTIDLLAGRVQFAIATPGSAVPQVKAGKLRALAAMLPNRSPLMPEVPTAAEAGLGKVTVTPWAGVFGPAKMPREIADRLSRELIIALARPDVREGLGKIAFEPRSSTPDELAAFLKEQLESWARTARAAGIPLE